MADPAQIDIIADRNVDHEEIWRFLNVDWTGSTYRIQVRLTKDTTGTPLLDHSTATSSFSMAVVTGAVSDHVAGGELSGTGEDSIYSIINPATGNPYEPTDILTLTRVRLGLLAFDLSLFPFPEERGDDLTTYYDIIRTPPTGSAEVMLRGKFIVRAGVTIP